MELFGKKPDVTCLWFVKETAAPLAGKNREGEGGFCRLSASGTETQAQYPERCSIRPMLPGSVLGGEVIGVHLWNEHRLVFSYYLLFSYLGVQ